MEPLDILHEIVAADRAARERYEAALNERDSFDERLEDLSREIKDTLMEHAKADVEAVRQSSENASAEQIAALDRSCEETIERLRRQFAEKKDEGVEAMFRMVVGLDD